MTSENHQSPAVRAFKAALDAGKSIAVAHAAGARARQSVIDDYDPELHGDEDFYIDRGEQEDRGDFTDEFSVDLDEYAAEADEYEDGD